jgi:DnaB-like helicase N terminal domain/AAA domain
MTVNNDTLPPSCPEAERGVLGCCLLDTGKTAIALKAGVSSRWFYDLRHIEIFNILAAMARNGGGDSLVATLKLRELGKLDHIGGPAYLSELQDAVPSAENLEFYLPDLRAYFQRRQVIDIGTRLRLLAQDPAADPATLFTDTSDLLQHLQAQAEAAALPEIVHANDFLAADIPTPPEIVSGVLHQGSKLILGGYSKSSLVIIDPTYKLLGIADENSATDITALLNMVDSVATTTGAAVVLAGHFAKGNASAKETIDRISGSGVFARDPDSLVVFTKHEEEGAFVVEMILRNLPPVKPFVVKWQYPLFVREGSLDPARLKHSGGRPPKHTPEMLLECLGNQRLTATEWQIITHKEHGVSESRFYELKKGLETAKEIAKSVIDDKWERIRKSSGNWYDEKDQ